MQNFQHLLHLFHLFHHHRKVLPLAKLMHGRGKVFHHFQRERVQRVRPVQGQGGDVRHPPIERAGCIPVYPQYPPFVPLARRAARIKENLS